MYEGEAMISFESEKRASDDPFLLDEGKRRRLKRWRRDRSFLLPHRDSYRCSAPPRTTPSTTRAPLRPLDALHQLPLPVIEEDSPDLGDALRPCRRVQGEAERTLQVFSSLRKGSSDGKWRRSRSTALSPFRLTSASQPHKQARGIDPRSSHNRSRASRMTSKGCVDFPLFPSPSRAFSS